VGTTIARPAPPRPAGCLALEGLALRACVHVAVVAVVVVAGTTPLAPWHPPHPRTLAPSQGGVLGFCAWMAVQSLRRQRCRQRRVGDSGDEKAWRGGVSHSSDDSEEEEEEGEEEGRQQRGAAAVVAAAGQHSNGPTPSINRRLSYPTPPDGASSSMEQPQPQPQPQEEEAGRSSRAAASPSHPPVSRPVAAAAAHAERAAARPLSPAGARLQGLPGVVRHRPRGLPQHPPASALGGGSSWASSPGGGGGGGGAQLLTKAHLVVGRRVTLQAEVCTFLYLLLAISLRIGIAEHKRFSVNPESSADCG
jgi:hypothetical protein